MRVLAIATLAMLPISGGAASAGSKEALLLNTLSHAFPASAKASYFEDPTGKLRIQDMADPALSAQFRAISTAGDPNFGFSHSAYWLALPLSLAAEGPPRWLLEVGYPSLDRVDVFTATTGLQDPHQIHARPSLIAKMRAARSLWARLAGACGADPLARIEARSSHRMLTRPDAWTNMIRLTAAGFAAAAGGADSVILGSFTDALGLPTEFARRQSRNAQLVLMEEAHVGRVAEAHAL